MKIKFLTVLFLITTLLTSWSGAQNTKTKIYQTACLDLTKILDLIDSDDDLKVILENYSEEQIFKAEEIQVSIDELSEHLANDKNNFSFEKKKELINEISFKKSLLEKILGQNKGSEENHFMSILYQVIERVAQREGFSLVVEKRTSVLFFTEEVDLTDRVINEIKNSLDGNP